MEKYSGGVDIEVEKLKLLHRRLNSLHLEGECVLELLVFLGCPLKVYHLAPHTLWTKADKLLRLPHLVADTALLILEAVPDTVKPVKGVRLLPLV